MTIDEIKLAAKKYADKVWAIQENNVNDDICLKHSRTMDDFISGAEYGQIEIKDIVEKLKIYIYNMDSINRDISNIIFEVEAKKLNK